MKETVVKLLVASPIMTTGIIHTYGTASTSLENIFSHNIITVGFTSVIGVGLYVLVCKVLRV